MSSRPGQRRVMPGRIIALRCGSALCRVRRAPPADRGRVGARRARRAGRRRVHRGRELRSDRGLEGEQLAGPLSAAGRGPGRPSRHGAGRLPRGERLRPARHGGRTVWEYARDWYAPSHPATPATEPAGPGMMEAAAAAPDGLPRRVITGGSWLCAPNFCARYRPRRAPADGRRPRRLAHWLSHRGRRAATRRVMRLASD